VRPHEVEQLLRRRKSLHDRNREHVPPARNVDGADGVQQFTPLRFADEASDQFKTMLSD
jgi:hypothetical protein